MREINNEKEFEDKIRNIISTSIITEESGLILFTSKKAVDILICKNDQPPTAFFLEIKYHKRNKKRLGFGQAKGAGFQPEVLQVRPNYFENNLRWILGSEESELYFLIDNDGLSRFFNNGSVGEKYNGIQKKIFEEIQGITEQELIRELKVWLGLEFN